MRVVLLVDAEVLARAQLALELRKLPELEVVDAGALHEAVTVLDCMHIDLVVAKEPLPDGRAEALAPKLKREGRTIPAIVITDQGQPRSVPPPSIDLLAGPVAPAVVRAQVAARLGWPRHMMQQRGMTPRAVTIPPRGLPLPRLDPSIPEHAEVSSPIPVVPEVSSPIPVVPEVSSPIPVVPVDDADFDRLYEQGIDAMLARRYDEALNVLERASRIRSTSTLMANLQRLRAMGISG